MDVRSTPSPNFNIRADNQSPSLIILHYTGTKTAVEAHERFCDPNPTDSIGRIAPHYLIDGDAVVWKYVEEDKRAWHAGAASWGNILDVNSASIGIEIWNSGHEYQCEDFQKNQIKILINLIHDIRTRWTILDKNILGHSDVAVGRKLDPGEKFPWEELAQVGIGLMPQVSTHTLPKDMFFAALKDYGYTYADDHDALLLAFRSHFLPHRLASGPVGDDECAALASLMFQSKI